MPRHKPYKNLNYKEKMCILNDYDECPDHPDLLLLRDAAADERAAIADYLDAALCLCNSELFLDIAEDEMQHYIEIMRLIARLDPVQAEMLSEEGLDFLTPMRPAYPGGPKWSPQQAKEAEDQDVAVIPPRKKDLPAIRFITKALGDELHAINKYQQYMNQAKEDDVKFLFCELMNDEKEHVAELTAALYKLTNEPLPEEQD